LFGPNVLHITHCVKHGVKDTVHQVKRKQTDDHKVYSKCLPLAQTSM